MAEERANETEPTFDDAAVKRIQEGLRLKLEGKATRENLRKVLASETAAETPKAEPPKK
jgi:hypothetical protein